VFEFSKERLAKRKWISKKEIKFKRRIFYIFPLDVCVDPKPSLSTLLETIFEQLFEKKLSHLLLDDERNIVHEDRVPLLSSEVV